ncbi:MAG: hypothetical protein UT55_C0008G0022 [Candidatus Peregrinibacteria bacterium GW2011_GWE2_39_6]|nr:MAG: hypothetical protein UT55_C0008G0022 [Candidatus Peregrinibacteria bacterium GW2011_GWE2_39_6]
MKKIFSLTIISFYLFLNVFISETPLNAQEENSSDDYAIYKIDVPSAKNDPDYSTRPVVMFAPQNIDPNKEYPLVLYFHGYGENNNVALNADGSVNLESAETNNYVKIVNNALTDLRVKNSHTKDWVVLMIDGRNCLDGTFYIYIETKFHDRFGITFSKDPNLRALVGHSMGGYGALRLSQLYSPTTIQKGEYTIIDEQEVSIYPYGIAAANNPAASWIATTGLALRVPSENDRNSKTNAVEYTFDNTSFRGQTITEDGDNTYTWNLHRLTDLLFALSATVDKSSFRPNDEACTWDSKGINYVLRPSGLISPKNLYDWLKQDVSNEISQNPDIWAQSHIYADGEAVGYRDEYYLQENTKYLNESLRRAEQKNPDLNLDFEISYYPNSQNAGHYSKYPKRGEALHFFDLTWRTEESFEFVANKMDAYKGQ